jgi:hypothetical protein
MPGKDPVEPVEIEDPVLRQLVRHILNDTDLDHLRTFEESLANVYPAADGGEQVYSLLSGRPLALVRLRLALQLRGGPARNHSWSALHVALSNPDAEFRLDDGFTDVDVPVHVGCAMRCHDGVVAFWHEQGVDNETGRAAPIDFRVPGDSVDVRADGRHVNLSVLIDPRADIHLRCGLLPEKKISIEPAHVSAALSRMQVAFELGPLLMPTGTGEMATPVVPGMSWDWHEQTVTGVETIDVRPPPAPARWSDMQTLTKGWLTARPNKEASE